MASTPESHETFRFGDFDLDVSAYELRFHGRAVQIERRPMDLLILLVERRGQLVSRQTIVEQLWGEDVFVEVEPGINTVVWKIRRALGDSSDNKTRRNSVGSRISLRRAGRGRGSVVSPFVACSRGRTHA